MAGIKRVLKELSNWEEIPYEDVYIEHEEDDMFNWKGYIFGPPDTPYENGKFKFSINLPQEYPFKPIKFKFETPMFHPNISDDGMVSIKWSRDEWTPVISIR